MLGIKEIDIFGTKALSKKVSELEGIKNDLISKTAALKADNQKMNSFITSSFGVGYQAFTGESNYSDLPEVKEMVIYYDMLRLRSWQFIFNNHIANLIVTKKVNWLIGAGLLFNAKPSEKPFIDYYGKIKGKQKHQQFIQDIEYQHRNFINSKEVDYTKTNNLHSMARIADYNASGDGDVFFLTRVENGYPNLQMISGQCICNPSTPFELATGHSINEGVELNAKGEVVAYHVLKETDLSNSTQKNIEVPEYGTDRISAYFKGTDIRQAWLYRASDLQKLGETRAMPLLSHIFEALQHLNDYIIANAKNAQLKAQMVISLEKDENSTGDRIFNDNSIDVPGMEAPEEESTVTQGEITNSASNLTAMLRGNGFAFDPPKGVKAKMINETSQSDQKEYLNSTLSTIFAGTGFSIEFMLSTYNSNYSASMGARSDTQHNLDVTTAIIPSNQLYKMNYNLFLYLQIFKGEIDCPPLKKAYQENDIITIQAISNSTFEGTKLKPIDPLKFINSLRAQIPEKYREQIMLNSLDNLVSQASNGDFEGIFNTFMNEVSILPKDLEKTEPVKPTNEPKKKALMEGFKNHYSDYFGELPDDVENAIDEYINEK